MAFIIDELHDFFTKLYSLSRAVRDAKHDQHVGPAHDTKTYFTVGVSHVMDLLQWIVIDFNNVIKKVYRVLNNLLQFIPLDGAVIDKLAQVDRAEVT